MPEQVPPSHSIGKCLSKSERAGVDDQKEVMQEEKKGEKGKSIEDPLCYEAEDERVHENSKVEKRLQRKNNISIEDTPTPYKKVKAKTRENLPKEKAVNLKEKFPENKDAISREISTKIKKASPIPKKLGGSEARKEEVEKVRQEHENGGDEIEVVRESSVAADERGSSLVREGRGARKKKAEDAVPELSSPQKKLRGGRRKKEGDEFEESSTENKNALLHVKEPRKKNVSQELSNVTKETVTNPGELFNVQPQESVKLSKQNLKGVKHGIGQPLRGRDGGKESGVLESSMLTKLAERKRRSEAMSAADWEETLQRFVIFCIR